MCIRDRDVDVNKIRRGNREGSRLFGYLMVVPATLLLVVVSIIPLLDGVYLAFTNTNLNTGADAWVCLLYTSRCV